MAKYYSETSPSWSGVQIGTICVMPKDSSGDYYAPTGWRQCEGDSLDPNQYFALYQIIGNTYGGTTTGDYPSLSGNFNLPDLRDRRVVGSGSLRPGTSTAPSLEQFDSDGSILQIGSTGGKNTVKVDDLRTIISVTAGTTQITYNTTRTGNASFSFSQSSGSLTLQSGHLSEYSTPSYPPHSHNVKNTGILQGRHGDKPYTTTLGPTVNQLDRCSPGGQHGRVKGSSNFTTEYTLQGDTGFDTPYPHSHWISFKGGIVNTTSYHRGWGDSIGNRAQNAHQDASILPGAEQWYSAYCVNANNVNEGNIEINNGRCTIQPTSSKCSANMAAAAFDGTQITPKVSANIGLDTDPDISPEYQSCKFMIYCGTAVEALTSPIQYVQAGDDLPVAKSIPGGTTITSMTVTTTSSDAFATAQFELDECDNGYQFDVEVTRVDGATVASSDPINVGGTGTTAKSGYRVNDIVSMSLQGGTVGGDVVKYRCKVLRNGVLRITVNIDVEYAVVPGITLSASPDEIDSGESSTLTWTGPVGGSYTVTDASWTSSYGSLGASGSTSVTPTTTTNYSITVQNSHGDNTATETVTVNTPTIPVIDFSANPSTVEYNGSFLLSWYSENASTFVSIVDDDGNSIATSGNAVSGYITQTGTETKTYTITLSNAQGPNTADVTVTVQDPPAATVSISADPSAINNTGETGEDAPNSAITWATSNASTVAFSSAPTDATWNALTDLSGTTVVYPTATTVYTITATNASGVTATNSVTVSVLQPPAVTLTASPTTLNIGGGSSPQVTSSTLTWSSTGATGVKSSNFGATTTSGSTTVSPTTTTNYTITVENAAGEDDASANVTVVCVPGTGTTANGYATTKAGYQSFANGDQETLNFVEDSSNYSTAYTSQIAKGSITYGQVFGQVHTSYANILSTLPHDTAFDGWVNAFINTATMTSLSDLNTAISNDANGIGFNSSNALAVFAAKGGLIGTFDECGTSIYP